MIREKIGAPETRRMLSGKIPEFADRIGSFLHSEYADKELAELFGPASGKLETLLAAELERKLPEIAGALLDSPDFKRFLHGQLVPAAGKMLERCMQRQGRGKIIACLDLSGRIEAAVKAQDVREFHAMINVVAAEHLGAIQVLGYFLGGLAGILLALVSFRG